MLIFPLETLLSEITLPELFYIHINYKNTLKQSQVK